MLGVGAPAWQGATSAHTGRMYVRSNEAGRDASASRMAQLFPDESLGLQRAVLLKQPPSRCYRSVRRILCPGYSTPTTPMLA